MYYIMIRGSSYAAGAHKAWVTKTRAEAELIAQGLDTPLNGQSKGKTFVLSECEYDDWYKKNVAVLYNKDR